MKFLENLGFFYFLRRYPLQKENILNIIEAVQEVVLTYFDVVLKQVLRSFFMRPGWLFQEDRRDERLEKIGSKLDLLEKLIPWESFRVRLEWMYKDSSRGGCPPYDPVMMMEILVFQGLTM